MSKHEAIYLCPSCKQPLCIEEDKENIRYIVHCGHNKCESTLANDGAEGQSIEEAVDALFFLVKHEKSPPTDSPSD